MHGARQPVHLVAGLEADGERLLPRGLGCGTGRLDGGIDVHQCQARVVEEGIARGRGLDAAGAARQQLDADLTFEIADLPAQRRLRGVQSLLRGRGQAARFGGGDEVSKMS